MSASRFFACVLPFLTGCSSLITAGGVNLENVTSREELQKKLGAPVASSEKDGLVAETYRSRQKIARSLGWRQGHGMVTGISFGLSEFIFFPLETYRACSRLTFGQRIEVTYGQNGSIATIDFGVDSVHLQPVANSEATSLKTENTPLQSSSRR